MVAHAREELTERRRRGSHEIVDADVVGGELAAPGEDGDGVAHDALAQALHESLQSDGLLLRESRRRGEDQNQRVQSLVARSRLGPVVVVVGGGGLVLPLLAPQEGADVPEVVLEQRAAVARSGGVHDPEHRRRPANPPRVFVDSHRGIARDDGLVVGVEGGVTNPASLRHALEGAAGDERVPAQERVARGALPVPRLAHEHDRESRRRHDSERGARETGEAGSRASETRGSQLSVASEPSSTDTFSSEPRRAPR